jgi:hypothetical protein
MGANLGHGPPNKIANFLVLPLSLMQSISNARLVIRDRVRSRNTRRSERGRADCRARSGLIQVEPFCLLSLHSLSSIPHSPVLDGGTTAAAGGWQTVDLCLVASDVRGEHQQSQTRASWAAAESNSSFLTMAWSPVSLAAEIFFFASLVPQWSAEQAFFERLVSNFATKLGKV